jgi:hypothetical protein
MDIYVNSMKERRARSSEIILVTAAFYEAKVK